MERIKKVICTVTNDLNYDQRMQRVCSSLVKAGYEVLLVGRKEPHTVALTQQSYQQIRLKSIFQNGFLMYAEYNIRLFFFLLGQKFDIINSVDLDSIMPGVMVSRMKGKKCTYDAHEYFTEVPEVVNRKMVKKIWEAVANVFIKKVDAAYTVGHALQKVFSDRYGIPFRVVRNAPIQLKQNEVQKVPKLILYQGALNAGRGLKEMIEAMKLLPEYELWIIGEGDLSQQLRTLAESQKNVIFKGHMLPAELKEITPKASIGINLLENKGLSYYYSLANRSFDFIQANVPAIHMDFPEYHALNQDHEVSVLIGDLNQTTLIEAVKKFDDPAFYQKLLKNNQLAAESLHWEKEELILLEIYKAL